MLNLISVGFILVSSVYASGQPQLYEAKESKFLGESYHIPNFKDQPVNNRPIIGVLTQPLSSSQKADPAFAGKTSYIMASYINALESAGARTVPLIYDGDLETELAKLDHLNGVFYCGGSGTGDYDVFGKKVFEKAKQMNDQGNYLPVWGTCLGFEDLAQFASSNPDNVLSSFDADDETYPLEFIVDPKQTQLFSPLGDDAAIFEKLNITYNHHSWGVSPAKFAIDKGLASIFYPTAISYDDKGVPFVAAMESKQYPFFGTQFHPEKEQFIFYPKVKIDHSVTSLYYNRYFSDFFVNKCRLNQNKFSSFEEEQAHITENYKAIVTKGYDGVDYAF